MIISTAWLQGGIYDYINVCMYGDMSVSTDRLQGLGYHVGGNVCICMSACMHLCILICMSSFTIEPDI